MAVEKVDTKNTMVYFLSSLDVLKKATTCFVTLKIVSWEKIFAINVPTKVVIISKPKIILNAFPSYAPLFIHEQS